MFKTPVLWLTTFALLLLYSPIHPEALIVAASGSGEGIPQMERRIFELANQERAHAGLPLFKWNNNLAIAARLHSDEMAQRHELSHQFNGEAELGERLAQSGASFDADAENVGFAGDVDGLHSGWMHSPPHRANLLSPRYDQLGVGITRVGDRLYATQDFAHGVTRYSGGQAADEVISAYNNLRQGRRVRPAHIVSVRTLEKIACADEASAKLPRNANGAQPQYIFNYTTSDLHNVPEVLRSQIVASNISRIEIGVCARHPAQGFSGYRVIAALY